MDFRKLILLLFMISFLFTNNQINAIEINKKNILKAAKILTGLGTTVGFASAYYFDTKLKSFEEIQLVSVVAPITSNFSKHDFQKMKEKINNFNIQGKKKLEDKKNIALTIGVLSLSALGFFHSLDK